MRTALPVSGAQLTVTMTFFIGMIFIGRALLSDARDAGFQQDQAATTTAPSESAPAAAECTPPDCAVSMGHTEKWKLHHNCK